MKISRIYLKLIILCILVIGSVVGLFFLLETTFVYSEEYFKGKSEFYSLQEKVKGFYNQQKIVESSQQKASIISKAFLRNEEFVNFIKELEGLGTKHNVLINIISVTSPTKEKPYFIFQIGIEGDFSNFLKTLFAIENNPFLNYRLMSIQKISIKRVVRGAAENNLSQESSVDGQIELWVYAQL